MKDLAEYMYESSKAQHYDINNDTSISISNDKGFITFDKRLMDKLLGENEYDTDEFIKSVFKSFKDAKILWLEEIEFDGNYDPIKYVKRDEQKDGWRDEHEFENYPNPFRS